MNPVVEKFLADSKAKEKEKKKSDYENRLMEAGYFDKEYAPVHSDEYAEAFPFVEQDESGKKRYYKKVLSLSDEDIEALDGHLSDNKSQNGIATAVKVIAILTYLGAFIYAFALADTVSRYSDESIGVFLLICVAGAIVGTFILGFSEIINLLHQINNKSK